MGGVAWSAGGEDGWPVALRELIASERAFPGRGRGRDPRGLPVVPGARGGGFRPRPVPGRPAYEQMPADATALLAWRPSSRKRPRQETWATHRAVEFENRRQDPDPAGWGHYVSVWRKGRRDDGRSSWMPASATGGRTICRMPWRSPNPAGRSIRVRYRFPDWMRRCPGWRPERPRGRFPPIGLRRSAILSRPHAACDRPGQVAGPAACGAGRLDWRADGQAASADGSGIQPGILETRTAAGDARPALQYSYLHIWRRGGDGYRLVLDLAVAIPVASAP